MQDDTSTEISRSAQHDLESFCWVLVWSIYRKMPYDSSPPANDDQKTVNLEFKALFGQIKLREIIDARFVWLAALAQKMLEVTRFLPGPVAELLTYLKAIYAQNWAEPSTPDPYLAPEQVQEKKPRAPITYPYMKRAINGTIGKL